MNKRIASRLVILITVSIILGFSLSIIVLPSNKANAFTHSKALALSAQATVGVQITPNSQDPTVVALQKEQLELQISNAQYTWQNLFWNNVSPFLVFLLALLGGFRWLRDRHDEQRRLLDDRHIEREKKSEQDFQAIIGDLSSEDMLKRTSAVILLRTFLRPGHEQFCSQIFDLTIANLSFRNSLDSNGSDPKRLLKQGLVTLFQESFHRARDWLEKQDGSFNSQMLDAAGIHLNGVNLSGADFRRVWMPGSYLEAALLKSADLSMANLSEATLTKADLSAATLREANLAKADLTGAILEGTELSKVVLDAASLTKTNLRNAHLKQAVLIRANLTRAILRGADLTNAVLDDANLSHADLTGANLTNTSFTGSAKLRAAILARAVLIGADFTNADLTGADLSNTNPKAARSFAGAKMQGVIGLDQEMQDACVQQGATFS